MPEIYVLSWDGEPFAYSNTRKEMDDYLKILFIEELKNNQEVVLKAKCRHLITDPDHITCDMGRGLFCADITTYNTDDFYPYWCHEYIIEKIPYVKEEV